MLTTNLDKDDGLVNGAQGTIYKILYQEGRMPPQIPDVVYCEFPSYTGNPFMEEKPQVVPIAAITRTWMDSTVSCTRTQLPLVPAYAITVHKCQGQTLSKVVVELGKREFSVGLSNMLLHQPQ